MNESGPVRKTFVNGETALEYGEFIRIAPNVWRATLDAKYWLLKTAKNDDADSFRLLRREYEIACNLSHPHIVGINRFETASPKGPAIVMDYIAGRTLREFIAENPSVSKRRKILSQLLDSVEYLHFKGILHNDIKSENVLITEIGDDVKLIDFGLSETDADYLDRRLGGTRGASAPEVLSGDLSSSSTASSDIYALGGVICLLFPGRYRSVVRKCHRENPQERYKDIDSLRRAIAAADRAPWIALSITVFILLLSIALVPYFSRSAIISSDVAEIQERIRNEDEAKEILQAKILRVQKDMASLYKDFDDSINNRSLVPYKEFASLTFNTFVHRLVECKKGLEQELKPVCDSIYERYYYKYIDDARSIPWMNEANLPQDERKRCSQLYCNNKPYTPPTE